MTGLRTAMLAIAAAGLTAGPAIAQTAAASIAPWPKNSIMPQGAPSRYDDMPTADLLAEAADENNFEAGAILSRRIRAAHPETFAWAKAGAERKDPKALVVLGDILTAQKNDAAAMTAYQTAADLGHAPALTRLARNYRYGAGVAKDPARALALLKQAADLGDKEAMFDLHQAYDIGDLAPKDAVESKRWVDLYTAHGGQVIVMPGPLPVQSPPMSPEARDKLIEKARAGDVATMKSLGLAYQVGRDGFPRDRDQSVHWYKEAAALGDAQAMGYVASSYLADVPGRDKVEALRWYLKSAEAGYAPSATSALRLYRGGDALPADAKEARALVKRLEKLQRRR